MTRYEFTLIVAGTAELDDDLAEALFAAGCDDGSPGTCNSILSIDFHREADSLENAIRSAIAQVQSTGCVVERVEFAAAAMQVVA